MNIAHIFIGILTFFYLIWVFIDTSFMILYPSPHFEYYQLLSSSFVHGNFEHYLFNSIIFLMLGRFVVNESEIKFIVQWIIFAIWASLVSCLIEPWYAYLWASWVGLWMISYTYLKYRKYQEAQWLLVLIIINILYWFMPGISFWGHLGGAISGLAYYFIERYWVGYNLKVKS